MKVVILLIAAVCFLVPHCTECRVWRNRRIGNRIVKVYRDFVNFTTAVEYCKSVDRQLLMVHNLQEEEQAIAMARKSNLLTIWLAATDNGHESTFVSATTGKRLTYTNWTPGEPNNANGNENCVQLVANPDFLNGWNDNSCDHSFNAYFCEPINNT